MSSEEIQSKTVKCRKDHWCEWCEQRILSGEKAQYRVYIFDGDFNSGHMHLECFEAMNDSDQRALAYGWTPGEPTRGKSLSI